MASEKEMTVDEWLGAVIEKKKAIAAVFETTKDQRIAAGIVALLESADDPLAMLEATRIAYKKMNGFDVKY